jgi:hypothetical protein
MTTTFLPIMGSFTSGAGAGLTSEQTTILSRVDAVASTKLPANTPIILFGDSLEQHNGTASATAGSEEFSNWSRGAMNWVMWLRRRGVWVNWLDVSQTNKYYFGCNQGITGNDLLLHGRWHCGILLLLYRIFLMMA